MWKKEAEDSALVRASPERRGQALLDLEMVGGHKPRNAGSLQKQEKARKWILLYSLWNVVLLAT